MLLLAACADAGSRTPTVTEIRPLATTTATGDSTAATARPTQVPTQAPDVLVIWWPAALYPTSGSTAEQILNTALDDYQAANGSKILIRVKRNDGTGGILETLRSGSFVAPAAMPDLALMRRSDLVQAAAAKLIEPLTIGTLPADDLFTPALILGQVNGQQYGIPYALEVEHAAYRTTAVPQAPQTLKSLLIEDQAYVFPANVSKGVNTTLLAQYIAAGGHIINADGKPVIDAGPLQEVLAYYEQAVTAKLAGSALLEYSSAVQYLPMLGTGKINVVQLNSTLFLAQRAGLTAVEPLAPPMLGNNTVIAVDAWQWVITTTNAAQQAKAMSVLAWMLRAPEQGQYTQALGVIPSRRTALEAWDDAKYSSFISTLLNAQMVPTADTISPTVASALQSALADVLTGRKTASTAANDAAALVEQSK